MRVGETDRAAAMNEDVERQQANDQSFSPDHQNAIGHEEKKKLTQLEATLLVKIELVKLNSTLARLHDILR